MAARWPSTARANGWPTPTTRASHSCCKLGLRRCWYENREPRTKNQEPRITQRVPDREPRTENRRTREPENRGSGIKNSRQRTTDNGQRTTDNQNLALKLGAYSLPAVVVHAA